jgi:ABC-type antimicrobial peptide transport system permease subunit
VPLAWWVLNGWLQDFQYRIQLSAGIFIVALVLTALIACITVGYQSLRASLVNPIKSLRTE